MKPKLTEEQSKALREDGKNGMTNEELCKKYGVVISTVCQHRIHVGRKKLSEKEVRQLRRMYKEGMQQRTLAAHFGVTVSHIQSALKHSYFAT